MPTPKRKSKEGVRCRSRRGSNRFLLMCRQPAGQGEQGQRQLQMGIHPELRRRHQHRALKILGWTISPGPGPDKPEDRGEHRHREPNEGRRARGKRPVVFVVAGYVSTTPCARWQPKAGAKAARTQRANSESEQRETRMSSSMLMRERTWKEGRPERDDRQLVRGGYLEG